MTTTQDTRHQIPTRLDVDTVVPAFSRAMSRLDGSATQELDRVGFPAGLRELVRLRASQLNGCAYCVDTHSADAASAGESAQRLQAVAVWNESPFFTERERAALRFTEVVTRVADTRVPQEEYDAVAAQWSPDEVGALLALVVTINAWNAIAVASRAWEPVLAG
ncbi:MAG TPA: carboxymuconolactone decarboxylase family protein [Nocardioides sp.]|jgi:AhpD family alkylhydroperoxidase|nr:carboxymuconolactone decarboxylase family protein [Nocardioides sp.]